MIIFKKEKPVVRLCLAHADKMLACAEAATAATCHWVRAETDAAKGYHDTVGRLETEADELRREIRNALYEGAYLPQIREDLFRLIQSVDDVANKCEDVWEFFATQIPDVPAEYRDGFVAMMDLSLEAARMVHDALTVYFKPKGKIKRIREQLEAIYLAESRIDKMEWKMTRRIFKSDLELSQKTQLQRALRAMSNVSDKAQDVAYGIDLIAMKSVV
ncbi:MAG: DUF47 family protein [Pseudomonadota bacterium]